MPPKGWSKNDSKNWEQIKAAQLLFGLTVSQAKTFIQIHGKGPYQTGLIETEVIPVKQAEPEAEEPIDIGAPFSLEDLNDDSSWMNTEMATLVHDFAKAHRRWVRGKAHLQRLNKLVTDLMVQRDELQKAVLAAESERNLAISTLTSKIEEAEGVQAS